MQPPEALTRLVEDVDAVSRSLRLLTRGIYNDAPSDELRRLHDAAVKESSERLGIGFRVEDADVLETIAKVDEARAVAREQDIARGKIPLDG